MSAINTFVIPFIRSDFIGPMLDSLKEHAGHEYNVIAIDQTTDRKAQEENESKVTLWIRPYRNLGFAKAMNLGVVISQTPYITMANDDLEFFDPRWWQGILDTFAMDERIVAVNPMSPKEGAWGYGLRSDNEDTWKPPKGYVYDGNGGIEPDTPYKIRDAKYYDWLVNEHPGWQKGTLCDGIAMWCTVFKREGLQKIGLLDERFYPGGGEDYDMDCRAYSQGLRMVGSTKSWIWHHWGRSKDAISGIDPKNTLFASRERWNANEELWGKEFDIWGKDKQGIPLVRKSSIYIDDF